MASQALDTPDPPLELQRDVQRKLGRCLLRLQQYEILLKALVAHDEFEVIDWPTIFGIQATPFAQAVEETFNDPVYSSVVLEF